MRQYSAWLLIAFFAVTAPLHADVSTADLASLARGADRVLVATVTRVEPVFQTNEFGDRLIVSRTHLRLESSLKGRPGSTEAADLVMELEGGTIGELTLTVSDLPTLSRGERAVVFLRQNSRGTLTPHGRGHGILKLDAEDRVKGSGLSLSDVRSAVGQAR